jgi:hypothetical protein
MSNLTKDQKDILAKIEKEFTKMNDSKAKPFGLISKEFFDKERADIDNEIRNLKIEEDAQKQMIQDMMKRDIKFLNKDLSPMGLIATKYICNSERIIRIDVKGNELTNYPDLTFDYRLNFESVYFADKRSTYRYLGFIGIDFYTHSSCSKTFKDLKDLCANEQFIAKIRNYYEDARNKGLVD